jgi:hypothetical protein
MEISHGFNLMEFSFISMITMPCTYSTNSCVLLAEQSTTYTVWDLGWHDPNPRASLVQRKFGVVFGDCIR